MKTYDNVKNMLYYAKLRFENATGYGVPSRVGTASVSRGGHKRYEVIIQKLPPSNAVVLSLAHYGTMILQVNLDSKEIIHYAGARSAGYAADSPGDREAINSVMEYFEIPCVFYIKDTRLQYKYRDTAHAR